MNPQTWYFPRLMPPISSRPLPAKAGALLDRTGSPRRRMSGEVPEGRRAGDVAREPVSEPSLMHSSTSWGPGRDISVEYQPAYRQFFGICVHIYINASHIYIYIYICVCVSICKWIYIYIYIYIFIYLFIYLIYLYTYFIYRLYIYYIYIYYIYICSPPHQCLPFFLYFIECLIAMSTICHRHLLHTKPKLKKR